MQGLWFAASKLSAVKTSYIVEDKCHGEVYKLLLLDANIHSQIIKSPFPACQTRILERGCHAV